MGGKRIALTLLAAVLFVLGLATSWLRPDDFSDPPRPPRRLFSLYVMSGQMEDIGVGLMTLVLAVGTYRSSRKRRTSKD